MTVSVEHSEAEAEGGNEPSPREVNYEHSRELVALLAQANLTVLVSTYQAGKLVIVGTHQDQLALGFHNFDRPMGVAFDGQTESLAVAARDRVWYLRNASDVASGLEPKGRFQSCWLTRRALMTGEIQAHEMAWVGDDLWIVNTLFSCLCSPHPEYSFVPRWRPRFISELAPEDRCHLNGLALAGGRPKFVTAMAETNAAGGWRANKTTTGCLIDIDSSETVARGFAMPHSPRVHNGRVWLLDSGRGGLVAIDPANGKAETVARFPGYVRGMTLHQNYAFIGLSKIRETSTFGGVPIAEDRERLKCGFAVVDLDRASLVGQFEFKTGVDEIFDVSLIPNNLMAELRGPFSREDGQKPIWVVPEIGRSPAD